MLVSEVKSILESHSLKEVKKMFTDIPDMTLDKFVPGKNSYTFSSYLTLFLIDQNKIGDLSTWDSSLVININGDTEIDMFSFSGIAFRLTGSGNLKINKLIVRENFLPSHIKKSTDIQFLSQFDEYLVKSNGYQSVVYENVILRQNEVLCK